jgi:hypothetical protein
MPLKEIYTKLLSIGHITPLPFPPLKPHFPIWYKPKLNFKYHAGNPGYSIDTCYAFKKKLLQLFKAGWITFKDTPNINSNSFPKHASSSEGVNAVECGEKKRQVPKATMNRLYDMLMQVDYLPTRSIARKGNHFCRFHEVTRHIIKECGKFHQKVAQMMTLGLLRIGEREGDKVVSMIGFQEGKEKAGKTQPTRNGPLKLILTRPVFTYNKNYSVLPHHYGSSSLFLQTEIDGLTYNGRCLHLKNWRNNKRLKARNL